MDQVLDTNGQPIQAPPGMIAVPPTQQFVPDTETPEQKYARLYTQPPSMQAQPPMEAPPQAAPVSEQPDMAAEMAAMRAELAQLRRALKPRLPLPRLPQKFASSG
jgi:hypothetical protein